MTIDFKLGNITDEMVNRFFSTINYHLESNDNNKGHP